VGKYISKIVALALVGLLLPSLAGAAGLGKLTVLSALGQPLKAEIEIVSLQPGEADSLTARLAAAEAFRQANIDRAGILLSIRFAVEARANSRYVVSLTSAQPISEPFLDLLVELNGGNGRLLREYTFLLDPPEYKVPAAPALPIVPSLVQPVPALTAVPQQARPSDEEKALAPAVNLPPATAPAPAPAPTPALAPTTVPTAKPAPAPVAKQPATYEVQRGDTLAKIANEFRPQGVTLQQMLAALYRRNQDVFDDSNMNRMRAGKILNLPEPEAVASMTQEEASRLVVAQGADYAAYRRQLGAAVAAAPERAERRRQVSGRIGTPPEEKTIPAKEPAKDQLRLSKTDDAKAPGRVGAAARADDAVSREKALKDASERIVQLEKNVQELQRLLQLKSEGGAQLQQAAKAAPAESPAKSATAPAAAVPKAAEPAKAAPVPAAKPDAPKAVEAGKAPPESAKVVEPSKAEEAAAKGDAAKDVPGSAEAVKAPPPVAAKTPPKKIAPPPAPETNFVDELLDDPILLGGAGAVLILIGGYAAYARRKKRGLEPESIEPSVEKIPPVIGKSEGQQIDAGAAAFPSDFSQAGIDSAEEIDPIAEAEVYMAYGRDTQAEEILKEALSKDSSRHAVRAKLLEIYANRKDLKAFEATASEMQSATHGQGKEWEKAVSLGLSVDPQNPLYGGRPAEAGAGDVNTTQILTQAELAAVASASPDAMVEAETKTSLDFDLDLSTPAPNAAEPVSIPTETAEAGLDFDLDIGGPGEMGGQAEKSASLPGGTPAAAAPAVDLRDAIDFDLGKSEPAPAAQSAAAIDFELSLPEDTKPAEERAPDIDFGSAEEIKPARKPDIELGSTGETKATEEKLPDIDLSEFSLDLGAAPSAEKGAEASVLDAHWQEVATKLDLAKAYEEMGDKDGARELLNEVVNEGDAAQQTQAKAMLEALG
jgi:pilus assembly protein FimV